MRPTVMVIDDDLESRLHMCAHLATAGATITGQHRHGVDASQAMESHAPDILFVAIEEPYPRAMLTVDFARNVNPDCAIVGYSSDTSPALLRRVMRADVMDLLEAPLGRQAVSDAYHNAKRVLERRTVAAEHGAEYGQVIAVAGQKGGIGKTTISANIASVLAGRTANSVLIIDLDTRFGDVAVAMDAPTDFTTLDAIHDIDELDRDGFRQRLYQHRSGAFVLPSRAFGRERLGIDVAAVEDLVRASSTMFDVVVLDTPGTLDEVVAAGIRGASRVVAVTSPDLTSVKNTNLLLACLESENLAREDVVVTLSHHMPESAATAAMVARLLETAVDYEIPHDPAITTSTQLGVPIVESSPRSAAARSFAGLATAASGIPATMPNPSALREFLARMVGRSAPAFEPVHRQVPATVHRSEASLAVARK